MNRWLTVLLLLVMGTPAWAEEQIRIEEVVVTASKIEEPLEETTSAVTVITAEEIEGMHVAFVPDVFRRVPDMNVVQSGGDGKLTSVFLRGGDSKQILVMVDGIKVNNNTDGLFDFSRLPVEDIERIEIVKGAQSTIYGSEAVAGVINIITKKGEGKLNVSASLEGGSFGTYAPAVTVSGSERSFHYRITGQYFHTDGISAANDGDEKDEYNNAVLSWRFGLKPTQNSEIELFGDYSYDRSELDGFDFVTGRAADDPNYVQHGNHFMLAARGKLYLLDTWEQVLTLSTIRNHLKFEDPDTPFNAADILNKRQVIDWQHNLYLSNAVTLTGGFEYREEDGENKGNFDETVDNKAAYFNSKVKLFQDRLIVNAGVRYDDHETAGSETTYRVGAAYRLSAVKEFDLTVRSSYGTGFRAPALNDLFFPFFGNPSLEPEESESFDIGFDASFFGERLFVSVSYFDQDYENLIQADPLTFTATNIARASITGVEASASLRLTEVLNLRAGYTYLDTEDKRRDISLIRRPTDKASLSIAYAQKDVSVLADVIYVGSRLNDTAGNVLSPYTVVNLSGSYAIRRNITLFARVENLFDEAYEEAAGYGTKGISAYGGIRLTL